MGRRYIRDICHPLKGKQGCAWDGERGLGGVGGRGGGGAWGVCMGLLCESETIWPATP